MRFSHVNAKKMNYLGLCSVVIVFLAWGLQGLGPFKPGLLPVDSGRMPLGVSIGTTPLRERGACEASA